MQIVATKTYDRRARRVLTPVERATAELQIALAPHTWPVIAGTGGARKARVARGGKGKRSGARAIYFVWVNRDTLYLLDVYTKNEKEDLSDDDKKEIRRFLAALQDEE